MPALTCCLQASSLISIVTEDISRIVEDCDSLKPLPCNDSIQCRQYISKCIYISVCLHWTWDTLCCPHTCMYTRSPVSFSWHSMDMWYMCGLYWTLLLGQVTHDRCCQCLLVLSGGPMLQWCWRGCSRGVNCGSCALICFVVGCCRGDTVGRLALVCKYTLHVDGCV